MVVSCKQVVAQHVSQSVRSLFARSAWTANQLDIWSLQRWFRVRIGRPLAQTSQRNLPRMRCILKGALC